MVFGIYWIPLRALNDAGFSDLWATFVFNLVPLALVLPLAVIRIRNIVGGSRHFHLCGALMGLGYVFYASSFLYTEVIRAILLFYLMPIWGFLLTCIVTGDPITSV